MDWREAETLRPGDEVHALSERGPLHMRVVSGPTHDGEFEVLWLCDPEDWDVLTSGGNPGDEWDEWKVPWPIESVRRRDALLTAVELHEVLHDAWVDLDAVVQEPGTVIIRGFIERPILSRDGRLGRFPFDLLVEGELTAVEDDERVGHVPIESVTYVDGALRIEGSIPGRIVISTRVGEGRLRMGKPFEERHWFRWRPVR
ncbi:MAG TPA: hypothetical protein VK988_14810 [Acidimicrobiales bacterium]|nr:hypothetical protein [Acidimicrobiales bacterium]